MPIRAAGFPSGTALGPGWLKLLSAADGQHQAAKTGHALTRAAQFWNTIECVKKAGRLPNTDRF